MLAFDGLYLWIWGQGISDRGRGVLVDSRNNQVLAILNAEPGSPRPQDGALAANAVEGTWATAVAPGANIVGVVVPDADHAGWLNLRISNPAEVVAGSGVPMAMALGFGSVWVAEFGPDELVRVDVPSGAVRSEARLPFTPSPSGLAAGPTGVWLSAPGRNSIVRIDPKGNRTAQTVRVGRYPTGLAFGAGSVWVANHGDGTVSRIDPSGKVVATIPVGPAPSDIAVGAGGVWVAVHPRA
jgi:YVTN family beta-propeller protein